MFSSIYTANCSKFGQIGVEFYFSLYEYLQVRIDYNTFKLKQMALFDRWSFILILFQYLVN